MRIDHDIPATRASDRGVALTIGNFDGVHRGHRVLLDEVVRRAAAAGAEPVVITFDPHPLCVLRPDACPEAITTLDEKRERLEHAGMHRVVVQAFTEAVSQWTATEFMNRVLTAFDVRDLVIGHDFALGHKRQGDAAFLRAFGAEHGYELDVVDVLLGGASEPVSSTFIRTALRGGDIAAANAALGYTYFVDGRVEHGEKQGRGLGFPTINLSITPGKCLPQRGVYAGWARIGDAWHMAATNVGYRPTFGGDRLTVEAFLLDFDDDVYGERVRLAFTHRLRDEVNFAQVNDLIVQMHQDVDDARRLLGTAGPPTI